ncbi:MAG: hypothetical protein I3273_03495 [Candidatus Moeniiplasma glomeromycotorum]|nr:hypothetical protein [Candidatus Moeniiplasma glomeromycotorum]MCE8162167.1 hypothetical protein [Candidatus Moeniiplasma glomeromycotorum]MCE8163373.1 hypothetical protein [Candidatus Moeniiplasma glomeromycotorum]MCE8166178.1 hypothetical protein [Candidatus Moeniiplasma glomeromycotorum]MCE8166566.1 hypothetical protein [Candidatus Moeniiplasma glomeromycotorum]
MERSNLFDSKKHKTFQDKDEAKWILDEMIKNLDVSCKKKEVDYAGVGEDLLRLYEELINTHCYQSDNELDILKDLKVKLKEIKKWKAIDYNKEIAHAICQYLKKEKKMW